MINLIFLAWIILLVIFPGLLAPSTPGSLDKTISLFEAQPQGKENPRCWPLCLPPNHPAVWVTQKGGDSCHLLINSPHFSKLKRQSIQGRNPLPSLEGVQFHS